MSLREQYIKHKDKVFWAALLLGVFIVLYEYYGAYDSIFLKALTDLIKAWFIYVIWSFSRDLSSKSKSARPIVYGKTIAVCAVLAIFAWATYGTHIEDADPMFGGGDRVVDFVPTKEEKNEHGWYIFFSLAIPALIGVGYGLEDRKLNEMGIPEK